MVNGEWRQPMTNGKDRQRQDSEESTVNGKWQKANSMVNCEWQTVNIEQVMANCKS
ncbi:hypothetical protein PAXRUDRAFT_165399 [Paxillus rubicundulus Ve08.2h10]|uniref:Uncharacterized protein n=1 Tax=Paxillus rubicundulus Ve08.2h10 TaxID=930991 RepID=A0A0D0DIM7_9AGAM|nr:hypothetical protein PAXRUDRAFT_165399 [Paxillus rubicundulus Ve08.2h10]